ncbi:MAG: DUF115 domain-containing protein [Desulfobacteraceae bacterium]|nr:DUF115 domain-containing protein [Desulfobacteraceae bacterium]
MELTHSYFQENLALLKKHHPAVWQAVMDYVGEPLGEFCLAPDGNHNLLICNENGEKFFLHDPNSPLAELAEYYARVPEETTGVAVFIGMGLGYTPKAMLQARPGLRHLMVFEPEVGIFIQALHAQDLTSLFTDHRVRIAIGSDVNVSLQLAPLSRALQLESLHILQHLPCFRLAKETYQALYDEVYKHGNSYNMGGNTTAAYGGKFIANRFRHLTVIHHQQLLEHLQGSFDKVPAIIVAGGPSLDKNIHLLPKAKGSAVIIAADTALPALLAHGVVPDFTCSIDMQDITLEKIVDVAAEANGTSLICSSWLTPRVSKNFPARQVYWSFTGKNMEKWLNDLLGGKVLTTGAGTVAQLNFLAAYLLGCSPIVFVGQDLAFSDGAGHSRHTSLTSKDGIGLLSNKGEFLEVEGYGGNRKVRTNRAFLGHKHHFERAIATVPDRQFINATEGGVRLEGTEELPLQEVIGRYCMRSIDVAAVIDAAEKQGRMPSRRRMIDSLAQLMRSITNHKKDMALVEGLVAKLAKELEGLHERGASYNKFESLPLTVQQDIRKMDTVNAKLDKARIWDLLDEATMEGLRFSERLKHEIQQLADDPAQYLEWLRKAIERFAVINKFRRQVLEPFAKQVIKLQSSLQREDSLLRKLAKPKNDSAESVLELLRLYYENGDHVLLETMMAAYCNDPADSAELSFYLGVIAAHRSQFEQMEQHFSTVMSLDPSWLERINGCRRSMAALYLDFFIHWRQNDLTVAHRMLFKAVRYAPDYLPLQNTLVGEADKILNMAEAANKNAWEDRVEMLAVWSKGLTVDSNLLGVLGSERASRFHYLNGEGLFNRDDFGGALAAYQQAAYLSPQDASIQVAIFEAAFNIGQPDLGIEALSRAVALDRSLAGHWEELGDLLAPQQPSEALAAYEQCFAVQPGQLHLLKKIGDCYLAMNQLEAAHEAYRQLKEKIGGNISPCGIGV